MRNPKPKLTEEAVLPFIYPIKGNTKLQRPSLPYHYDFFDIAFERRSTRRFGLLLPGQLDALLWFAAKAIEVQVQPNGYVLSHRPSASAGARHPIDILVCSNGPIPTVAYYNPFQHSLDILVLDSATVKGLLAHINENLAMQQGVFLWLVAHPLRTIAKYDFAESLVWRDAGALLQQIQLTATAINLASCPVGTLAEPFAERLFGNSSKIISAGGIVVGNLEL
ncbi:nitroreductase family protein [Daejeonella sp.]|uniref:nitroreductase family protein n=1 Tax=Daejeonella sp. TaxID=2805397 RepID=UPI0030C1D3AA